MTKICSEFVMIKSILKSFTSSRDRVILYPFPCSYENRLTVFLQYLRLITSLARTFGNLKIDVFLPFCSRILQLNAFKFQNIGLTLKCNIV